ncbi:MAG: hypothetical protein R3296_13390 [Oleiphilaceae bacterium]|nr:hypothetical protein [Oleiphilaceae bacterium]
MYPLWSFHKIAFITLTLALSGCIETGSTASPTSNATLAPAQDAAGAGAVPVRVDFDPENGVIPFPNNLLFAASADGPLDGTLNIPLEDPEADRAALINGLNDLDGFSTIAAWRVGFTGDVDESSLVAGQSVRVFRLSTEGDGYPARIRPTAVERELVGGEDYQLHYDSENRSLTITPTQPLGYDRIYTAVLTGDIRDRNGISVGSPLQWSLARGTSRLDRCDTDLTPGLTLLQCSTNSAIAPIEADPRFDLGRDDMIMAWGVTTQRRDATFPAAAQALREQQTQQAQQQERPPLEFLEVASAPGEDAPRTPEGRAIVWPGTITLPSLVSQPADLDLEGSPATDPSILTSRWLCEDSSCNSDQARGLDGSDVIIPQQRHTQVVPALLALPDEEGGGAPRPADGYPVVIFQHALQQDRSNALALADRLAEQGYAVVAIDLPLHGLVLNQLDSNNETDAARSRLHALNINDAMDETENNSFTGDDRLLPMHERTYYLDLDGDGEVDPSGSHFINPAQPLMQRDILRQGALDLAMLTHYLRENLYEQVCIRTVVGGGGCSENSLQPQLNTHEIHFVSHSVGNLSAAPYLAGDSQLRSVSLLTPLAGVMRALEGSRVIGPLLREGLAENGVLPGTEAYFQFFATVQAALDAVEPLNHARDISQPRSDDSDTRTLRPVYLSRITGNSNDPFSPSDPILPPDVGDQTPLAGSTALARQMGLAQRPTVGEATGSTTVTLEPMMQTDGTTPAFLQATLAFRFGGHASPLIPVTEEEGQTLPNGEAAHREMQRQLANFLANQGRRLEDVDLELVHTGSPTDDN